MKQLICITVLCFCFTMMHAQKPFFNVQDIKLENTDVFPKFYSKKSKKGSERINQYLQLALLQTLLSSRNDTIKYAYAYKVLENTDKLLSVVFLPKDSSQSAAILKRNFLFNAATGQLVNLNDIMSNNGLADLKKTVVRHHTELLLKNGDTITQDQIKCLKNNMGEFEINRSYLKINSRNCYDPQVLCEASGIYPITLLPSSIYGSYLNQYGQALLSSDKKQKLRGFSGIGIGGLYAGKMNGQAVLVQVDQAGSQYLNAVIYNTETKAVQLLQGTFKNNRFEVDNELGKLNLTISSGHAQGYWRGIGSKTYAPITLQKL